MIRIEKYTLKQELVWNSFVKDAKNSLFMHNRSFMEYHKDRFTDYSLLFYDDDELIALLPCSINKDKLYSHGGLTYGGFITNTNMKQHHMNDCFMALRSYMKENNIESILYKTIPYIYYKQPAQEDIYSMFLNNATIVEIEPSTVINLAQPIKMPKGRKAQVGRARREGVEIVESTDFNTFIALENGVLSEYHNTKAVHTGAELELLHSYFQEQIKLYAAIYKGKMIAGTLVFIYDTVVHTQYMAANEEAREIGALDFAVSTVIEKYKDCKSYVDFGISSEDGGKFLNEGLISQKEGFGGRSIVYLTFEMKA
jgi:hypothetical protein